MARTGSKTFSDNIRALTIFGEDEPIEGRKNGRDAELIAKRNEHIMYRYHYYCTFTTDRWEVILPKLSEQFYISEFMINKIIQEGSAMRRRLINERPTEKQMREKFLVF